MASGKKRKQACGVGQRGLFEPTPPVLPPRWEPPDRKRGGATFDRALDYDRLNRQQRAVWNVVRDGGWHTLPNLSERTGAPEASVSARLRDFRKLGLTVERRRVVGADGLWEYQVRTATTEVRA